MILVALLLYILKMFKAFITALFLMIIESIFFALPLYFAYTMVYVKIGIPSLGYLDLMLILLGVKIIKFSTFEIAKLNQSDGNDSSS